MKPEVPIPPRMAGMEKDHRGWPVTYSSFQFPDGTYDFTTSDPRKRRRCMVGGLCPLCGQPLDKDIWFIGGPKCMAYHLFFDLGMHEECARYSLQVCPYLAMPNYFAAKKRPMPEWARVSVESSDRTKPDYFGLAVTDKYFPVVFQGDDLVLAHEWTRPIEWFKDSQPVPVGPDLEQYPQLNMQIDDAAEPTNAEAQNALFDALMQLSDEQIEELHQRLLTN